MTTRSRTNRVLCLLLAAGAIVIAPACSDSSSETASAEPDFAPSTLVDEEAGTEIASADEPDEPEDAGGAQAEPVTAPDDPSGEAPDAGTEDRTLVKARESRSVLGKTRDRAKDLRNSISGGADREGDLAETFDEHYITAGGLRWEVPEDWQINVPPEGAAAALHIPARAGDAMALVTAQKKLDAKTIIKHLERTYADDLGGNARAEVTKATIAGRTVHRLSVKGTFVGARGREMPFWAMRGAIVEPAEEGGESVMLVFQGPEDTVALNEKHWDAMLASMTQE